MQVHREIRKELNVQNLNITDIFRFPTLGALVKTIEEKTGIGSETSKVSEIDTDSTDKAAARSDAMARRRAMRARRHSNNA